jgi:hypothetical protein
MTAGPRRATTFLLAALAWASPARAGGPVSIVLDVPGYADNTEFTRNPLRKGETTFGASLRAFASARVAGNVELRGGVFANQRFGSDKRVDIVRPIIAVAIGAPDNRLLFGTLETATAREGFGPDLAGPHGLLPAVQIETLAFTRPYEAGLQWLFDRGRLRSDTWLDWQVVATPSRREVFDVGTVSRARIAGPLSLGLQLHEVHHGGQFATGGAGPVTDNFVAAAGLVLSPHLRGVDRVCLELYGLKSLHDPDRSRDQDETRGTAVFLRGSVEKWRWRLHGIYWRGTRYVKDEGDPNYFSYDEGLRGIAGGRSYQEAGLARLFKVAPSVSVEASARLHRIFGKMEYSYRILARAGDVWPLGRGAPALRARQ